MMQNRNRPRVDFPDAVIIICSSGELEDVVYFRKQLNIIFLDVLVICEIAYIVQNRLHGFHFLLRGESFGWFDHKISFMLSLYDCNETLSEVAGSLLHLTVISFLLLQLNFLVGHQSFQFDPMILAQRNIHIAGDFFPLRGLSILQLVQILRKEDIPISLFLVGCLDSALELRVLPIAECAC